MNIHNKIIVCALAIVASASSYCQVTLPPVTVTAMPDDFTLYVAPPGLGTGIGELNGQAQISQIATLNQIVKR